ITRTVHESPVIVWEWLNDTQKRLQWEGKEIRPLIRPGGRTGAGAQNHCVHGKNVSVETVLDWHPFESYTIGATTGVISYRLEAEADETRINIYSKIKMPLPRWLTRLLARFIVKLAKLEQPFDTLVRLIENDANKSRR